MQDQYDCLVIGGGPGGCTTAALVAESGHSTLLLEREKLPRYHIGESLMPETYWTLQRLGVLEKMNRSNFVKKYSVAFVSHTGAESNPFFFKEHDPRECSQTWQVERAGFDKMLFDNAAEKEPIVRTRRGYSTSYSMAIVPWVPRSKNAVNSLARSARQSWLTQLGNRRC